MSAAWIQNSIFSKTIFSVTVLAFLSLSTPASVHAGLIDTRTAVAQELRQTRIATLQALVIRDDVGQQLVALGVDPVMAAQRMAALSNAELASLERQIEQLPAGGDALALIGAVFLVLLILELVGVIDIFKKV